MRALGLSLTAGIAVLLAASPAAGAVGWFPPSRVVAFDVSQPSMVVDGQGHEHMAVRGNGGLWYLTDRTPSGDWARVRLTRDYVNDHGDKVTAGAPRIGVRPRRSPADRGVHAPHRRGHPQHHRCAVRHVAGDARRHRTIEVRVPSPASARRSRWWRATASSPWPRTPATTTPPPSAS